MKKKIGIFALATVFVFSMAACGNNGSSSGGTETIPETQTEDNSSDKKTAYETELIAGEWKAAAYVDANGELTTGFTDEDNMTFTFEEDGTGEATIGTDTWEVTWEYDSIIDGNMYAYNVWLDDDTESMIVGIVDDSTSEIDGYLIINIDDEDGGTLAYEKVDGKSKSSTTTASTSKKTDNSYETKLIAGEWTAYCDFENGEISVYYEDTDNITFTFNADGTGETTIGDEKWSLTWEFSEVLEDELYAYNVWLEDDTESMTLGIDDDISSETYGDLMLVLDESMIVYERK